MEGAERWVIRRKRFRAVVRSPGCPVLQACCMLFGDVGFGESYVEGEWDTPDIGRVIAWFLLNTDNSPAQPGSGAKSALINLCAVDGTASSISCGARTAWEHACRNIPLGRKPRPG